MVYIVRNQYTLGCYNDSMRNDYNNGLHRLQHVHGVEQHTETMTMPVLSPIIGLKGWKQQKTYARFQAIFWIKSNFVYDRGYFLLDR